MRLRILRYLLPAGWLIRAYGFGSPFVLGLGFWDGHLTEYDRWVRKPYYPWLTALSLGLAVATLVLARRPGRRLFTAAATGSVLAWVGWELVVTYVLYPRFEDGWGG